jgi:hypothetical protein
MSVYMVLLRNRSQARKTRRRRDVELLAEREQCVVGMAKPLALRRRRMR